MCNHHYSLVTLALIAFLFLACKEEPYVPVSYLTVIPATVEIMEGEQTSLSVWIRPDDATDKTVSWSSRNPSLVLVDPNGHVITLAPGETTIVAQVTDKTAECHITILRSPYNSRITFSDPGVESALVAAFDANGDGWISEGEASDVTTIEGVFGDRKDFRSFDEFRYFTHITRLPDHFFENWSSLQSIVLPGALKEIGERAFAGCSNLLELSLPDGVSRIGDSAFSGCRQLTSFRVPKDIEILPPSMLEGCSGLLSVVLPDKVRWIRERAFAGCSGLKGMDLGHALLRIDCGLCGMYQPRFLTFACLRYGNCRGPVLRLYSADGLSGLCGCQDHWRGCLPELQGFARVIPAGIRGIHRGGGFLGLFFVVPDPYGAPDTGVRRQCHVRRYRHLPG